MSGPESRGKGPSRGAWLKPVFYAQAALWLFAAVAPFGFDRPSSWGLDFGYFLLLLGLFGLLALVGFVGAIVERMWRWVLLQAGIIVVAPGAPLINEWVEHLLRR